MGTKYHHMQQYFDGSVALNGMKIIFDDHDIRYLWMRTTKNITPAVKWTFDEDTINLV